MLLPHKMRLPLLLTLVTWICVASRDVYSKPIGADDTLLDIISKALDGGYDKEKAESVSLVLELLAQIDLPSLCQAITSDSNDIMKVDDIIARAASSYDAMPADRKHSLKDGLTDLKKFTENSTVVHRVFKNPEVKNDEQTTAQLPYDTVTPVTETYPRGQVLPEKDQSSVFQRGPPAVFSDGQSSNDIADNEAAQMYHHDPLNVVDHQDIQHIVNNYNYLTDIDPLAPQYTDDTLFSDLLYPRDHLYDYYDINDNLVYGVVAAAAAAGHKDDDKNFWFGPKGEEKGLWVDTNREPKDFWPDSKRAKKDLLLDLTGDNNGIWLDQKTDDKYLYTDTNEENKDLWLDQKAENKDLYPDTKGDDKNLHPNTKGDKQDLWLDPKGDNKNFWKKFLLSALESSKGFDPSNIDPKDKDAAALFFPEGLLAFSSLASGKQPGKDDVYISGSESLKPELELLAENLKMELMRGEEEEEVSSAAASATVDEFSTGTTTDNETSAVNITDNNDSATIATITDNNSNNNGENRNKDGNNNNSNETITTPTAKQEEFDFTTSPSTLFAETAGNETENVEDTTAETTESFFTTLANMLFTATDGTLSSSAGEDKHENDAILSPSEEEAENETDQADNSGEIPEQEVTTSDDKEPMTTIDSASKGSTSSLSNNTLSFSTSSSSSTPIPTTTSSSSSALDDMDNTTDVKQDEKKPDHPYQSQTEAGEVQSMATTTKRKVKAETFSSLTAQLVAETEDINNNTVTEDTTTPFTESITASATDRNLTSPKPESDEVTTSSSATTTQSSNTTGTSTTTTVSSINTISNTSIATTHVNGTDRSPAEFQSNVSANNSTNSDSENATTVSNDTTKDAAKEILTAVNRNSSKPDFSKNESIFTTFITTTKTVSNTTIADTNNTSKVTFEDLKNTTAEKVSMEFSTTSEKLLRQAEVSNATEIANRTDDDIKLESDVRVDSDAVDAGESTTSEIIKTTSETTKTSNLQAFTSNTTPVASMAESTKPTESIATSTMTSKSTASKSTMTSTSRTSESTVTSTLSSTAPSRQPSTVTTQPPTTTRQTTTTESKFATSAVIVEKKIYGEDIPAKKVWSLESANLINQDENGELPETYKEKEFTLEKNSDYYDKLLPRKLSVESTVTNKDPEPVKSSVFSRWAGQEVRDRWSEAGKKRGESKPEQVSAPASKSQHKTHRGVYHENHPNYRVYGHDLDLQEAHKPGQKWESHQLNADAEANKSAKKDFFNSQTATEDKVNTDTRKDFSNSAIESASTYSSQHLPKQQSANQGAHPAMKYDFSPRHWSPFGPRFAVPNLGTLWGINPNPVWHKSQTTHLGYPKRGDQSPSSRIGYPFPFGLKFGPKGHKLIENEVSKVRANDDKSKVSEDDLSKLGVKQKTIMSEAASASNAVQYNGYACPGLFGYFGDVMDCRSFFICSWGVPYRFYCPSGLLWNPSESVCDWSRNVRCAGN